MEALLGILVGAILGFFLGLLKTHFDRKSRKKDFAESLQTEIGLATQGLEDLVKRVGDSKKKGRVKRVAGPALTRDVYRGCIGDLALLDSDTRYAVQNFYACLDDVEYPMTEMSSRWAVLSPADTVHMRDRLLERAKVALVRAQETLAKLKDV